MSDQPRTTGAAGAPLPGGGGGVGRPMGMSSGGDWWSERGAFIELNEKLDRMERKLDRLLRALKEQP